MATLFAVQNFGDTLLLVMPVDHKIDDVYGFSASLELAKQYALEGNIITFGIRPTTPDTNYGYIEITQSLENKAIYPVKCFKEKPDKLLANKFLSNGNHYWNSGIFLPAYAVDSTNPFSGLSFASDVAGIGSIASACSISL